MGRRSSALIGNVSAGASSGTGSGGGSSSWSSRFSRAVSSASATSSSASSARPWETSQRGEAGRPRRMNRMVTPPRAPIANRMRQPAAYVGHQHAGHEGHDRKAGVRRGRGPAGVAAAQRSGRELADVRRHRGDLGADPQPGDEAEHDETRPRSSSAPPAPCPPRTAPPRPEAELAAPLVGHRGCRRRRR